MNKIISLQEAVQSIPDGSTIGIGGAWFVRTPMAFIRELARQGKRDLTTVGFGAGLGMDNLIAAGCVKKIRYQFNGFDVFGLAPMFRNAIESGLVEGEELTTLSMTSGLHAAQKNIPFMPMLGPLGSDLMDRPGLVPFTCPVTGRKLVAAAAIQPDVTVIHVQRADAEGNVEIHGELCLDRKLVGAAKRVIVTAEEIVDRSYFREDPHRTTFPHFNVTAVVHAPAGAYPTSCLPYYTTDFWYLADHVERAQATRGQKGAQLTESLRALSMPDYRPPSKDRLDYLHAYATTPPSRSPVPLVVAEKDSFTPAEMIAVLLARWVQDGDICTVGSSTPLSVVAYLLAKNTHAPHLVIIPFAGLMDVDPYPMTLTNAEPLALGNCVDYWGMDDLYEWLYQKGRISEEIFTTAQIDGNGNLNTSVIGDPHGRSVRLPGQAGIADVTNLHQNLVVYSCRHTRERLVERVDYISGSRVLAKPEEREAVNLRPGSQRVMTNLGVFELNEDTHKLELISIHPGVTMEEIEKNTGFPIIKAREITTTEPPTAEELRLIREKVDPFGIRRLESVDSADRLGLLREIFTAEAEWLLGRQPPK